MSDTTIVPRNGSGEMFDRIAARYDLLNRIISLGVDQRWRRRTVDALELQAGETSLDLATGTADLAILTARRRPGARVIGFDPSRNMLAVGEKKLAAQGLAEAISLRYGAAERIDLPDASVDGVTMAFGIRNCVDRPAALREMARVTRPGRRVAILELCDPEPGLLSAFARLHIHTVVPWLGALLSGAKEYRYLHQSIAAFPRPKDFADVMRAAGLDVLDVRPMTFGVVCLYVATPRKGP